MTQNNHQERLLRYSASDEVQDKRTNDILRVLLEGSTQKKPNEPNISTIQNLNCTPCSLSLNHNNTENQKCSAMMRPQILQTL